MAKRRMDGLAYVETTWGADARDVAECALDRSAAWNRAVRASQKTMDGRMLMSLVSEPFLAIQLPVTYAIEMGVYIGQHLLPGSVAVIFSAHSCPGGDQKLDAPSFPELHGQVLDVRATALIIFLAEPMYRKRMIARAIGYLQHEQETGQRAN